MLRLVTLLFLFLFGSRTCLARSDDIKTDNIIGPYQVSEGMHYANKTSITWGKNGLMDWSVVVTLSSAAALYNCSETCDDPVWYYDYNKLWGKARCGYMHDHHKDSDRFVFRRCSDPTCPVYIDDGVPRIQLAAYSYDNGVAPYNEPGTSMGLLQEFSTPVLANTEYTLRLTMDAAGLSSFYLYQTSDGQLLEVQTVSHPTTCPENFNEGTVNGLYFGGDCRAPLDVEVTYKEPQTQPQR